MTSRSSRVMGARPGAATAAEGGNGGERLAIETSWGWGTGGARRGGGGGGAPMGVRGIARRSSRSTASEGWTQESGRPTAPRPLQRGALRGPSPVPAAEPTRAAAGARLVGLRMEGGARPG